ncbi:MAG: aminopeptidase P family protein [Planctomycetia bacterium]|nr:aminopeptidase P family protein [Planctomycetia bacterium]
MVDIHILRRNKVRRRLCQLEVDALLVTNDTNVRWLTGFTGGDCPLIISVEGDRLLTDGRFPLQVEREAPGLGYVLRNGPLSELVVKTFRDLVPSESALLAVEGNSITYSFALSLQSRLEERMTPLQNVIETIRQVKKVGEIEAIRRAISVAETAFLALKDELAKKRRRGTTELDVARRLETLMRENGAQAPSFPTIVAVGQNAAHCHAVPGNTRLGAAGTLLIDWGARVDDYVSDSTRVLVYGDETPSNFAKIYKIVLDAQRKAIDAIRPGVSCATIDDVARSYIRRCGYGDNFTHGLGHGIGVEVHEAPSLSASSSTVLKAGMVVTVEPGIYIPEWGGIRIEDDVLVTRDGCEVLTTLGNELSDVTI